MDFAPWRILLLMTFRRLRFRLEFGYGYGDGEGISVHVEEISPRLDGRASFVWFVSAVDV